MIAAADNSQGSRDRKEGKEKDFLERLPLKKTLTTVHTPRNSKWKIPICYIQGVQTSQLRLTTIMIGKRGERCTRSAKICSVIMVTVQFDALIHVYLAT